MPGDLLRYVSGPQPYSSWWLWLAVILVIAVIGWYVAVLVATMPGARLRDMPVLRDVHARLIRRRFAAGIRLIAARRRRGELSDPQACAAISQTVRSFLHQATGVRAQYLHLDEIAAGELAPAAPLIAALRDARFAGSPDSDPDRLATQAEELIRTWA